MPSVSPSARPEFAGFQAFYETELSPLLAQHERTRRAAVFNAGLLAGSLALLSLVLVFLSPLGTAGVEIGKLLIFVGVAGGAWLLRRARKAIDADLMPRICARLSLRYTHLPAAPYASKLRELGLTPQADKAIYSSEIVGERTSGSFMVCHARMTRRSSAKNRSNRTVFAGQLIVLDYPARFLGKTVVKRDLGLINGLQSPGRDFSRVGMASNEFERRFEAWSTDQVEARALLDPVVLERFLELERLNDGKNFRAAFADGKLYCAIENNNAFGIGAMLRPLAEPSRIRNMLREFDALFDLIDILVRPVEGRIDGAFRVDHVRGDGPSEV